MKQETQIKPCTCQHEWQDKTYGKGQRVHNSWYKQSGEIKSWTHNCTVCNKRTQDRTGK